MLAVILGSEVCTAAPVAEQRRCEHDGYRERSKFQHAVVEPSSLPSSLSVFLRARAGGAHLRREGEAGEECGAKGGS